jgi:acyl carrier protein
MPTHEDVVAIVSKLLREQMTKPIEVAPTHDIQNDLGVDSLGVMEVVAGLEDHYDVEISLDLLPGVRTVDQVARALESILAKKHAQGVGG